MPSMSGAMTVNRLTNAGHTSDQSQELNGYPWMRSSAGPVPSTRKNTSKPR